MPVGIGLVAGLGLGILGAAALGGFIVGVSPVDPLTIGMTTVLVVGTTLRRIHLGVRIGRQPSQAGLVVLGEVESHRDP